MGELTQQMARTSPGKLPLIGHTGRLALDPLAFVERQRTSDPVIALRLMGRECFLINTAEAAMQVLVLQQECFDKGGPFMEGRRCRG